MTTGATTAAIDSSHISEILDVAHSILQRHRDPDLADKIFIAQEYLEMSKMHPEWDYCELLNRAHADLISAVHLRSER
jgi:uncharacterized protein with gpF-like domain